MSLQPRDRRAQFFQASLHLRGLHEIRSDIPPDQSEAAWNNELLS